MLKLYQSAILFICVAVTVSCDTQGTSGSRGPIVIGDPSTIVTETDPQYLTTTVTDIQIQSIADDTITAGSAPVDATPSTPTIALKGSPNEGLQVAFNEVTLFIPGIQTKTYTKQDPKKSSGVSYQLTEGALQGNNLHITGATIKKVSLRYMTSVILTNSSREQLLLENLNFLTSWKEINGDQGIYPIENLELEKLLYTKASSAAILKAVDQAARKKRLSTRAKRAWETEAKKAKSVKHAPLSVVLRSVMWKIEGETSDGKTFVKQLRIDI